MKNIPFIFITVTVCFFFYSCEKESLEIEDIQQTELENEAYQTKWFGYCNSFKATVWFNPIFLGDINPASETGTLILEKCPNGNGSCTQVIQIPVRNGKSATFYSLGSEFTDSDIFRARIIPNEDGGFITFSTRLIMGPAYGETTDLGLREIQYFSSTYNGISFDFPEVCQ